MKLVRAIPSDMNADAVARIDARLRSIAETEDVAIPLAIESGSRAWGFPSPDSDYDCRFVFVRRVDRYLSPWPRRDVIETPLEHDLDVNGWELGKAVKLLLKGNAVIIEWLRSPICYGVDPTFRDAFLDLADRVVDRTLVARHYLHLGQHHRRKDFGDDTNVALKKIFYVLRPAAALRWLRMYPSAAVAPMRLQTLFSEADLPADVRETVDALVRLKAVTRELGHGPMPKSVSAFIDQEFELADAFFPKRAQPVQAKAIDLAETFFRNSIATVWS